MWIRSQKNTLVNLDNLECIGCAGIYIMAIFNTSEVELGTYKTKERTLEVLEDIQENIESRVVADELMKSLIDRYDGDSEDEYKEHLKKLSCVYVMPKE